MHSSKPFEYQELKSDAEIYVSINIQVWKLKKFQKDDNSI